MDPSSLAAMNINAENTEERESSHLPPTPPPSSAVRADRQGFAKIKPEFILDKKPLPVGQQQPQQPPKSSSNMQEAEEETDEKKKEEKEEKEDKESKKKRTRGMDRQRHQKMAKARVVVRQNRVRLCPSVFIGGRECKFGSKCDNEHSLENYWRGKPEDIGPECVTFNNTGHCHYSVSCRFANAHTDPANNYSQTAKAANPNYQPALNVNYMEVQKLMRKHQYDFSRADETVKKLPDLTMGAMEREGLKLDMRSLKGKRYLAPLTTVGNLPFRRLCVDLGAEITCGEMAMATGILQGFPSDLSLLKRHPSEKIFGVQLAGGYPDTLSRATQLIVDQCEVDFVDLNLGCPIDLVNTKGGGCSLANASNRLMDVVRCMNGVAKDVPVTMKMRYGVKEGERVAHTIMAKVVEKARPQLITLHPRSKDQRYTKAAEWDYVEKCAEAIDGKCPFWVCGDVLNYEDYYDRLRNYPVDGVMIGRGALIKPWLFTEIEERRHWDISATERLAFIRRFVHYGLENWGSDDAGVENTRRFLLEWLSFQCRYIPLGLLKHPPQRINERPPYYRGRNELETLLSSPASSDWVRITEMFLGKTPEGFLFVPKHNASAY